MSDIFQFNAPMKLCFGAGSLTELSHHIVGHKVFVVIDKFLYEQDVKKQIDDILKEQEVMYFMDFTPNPDGISIDKGLVAIREFDASTIIGIGGGSSLDIAKFIASGAHEEGNVEAIRQYGFRNKKKIKSICVPTTAGTGSEVTNVSVISNYMKKQKTPFVDDSLFADIAILDPLLTMSLPEVVTSSCGMDTLCHALEAYWNINAFDISDIFAKEALQLVFTQLSKCYQDGSDVEARSGMLKASLYAGIAFAQTRTTILHAISFPLTSKFHVPHGLACALLLPSCLRYFGEGNIKIQVLVKFLHFTSVETMAIAIEELMASMNMKTTLHEHGITKDDLEMIASQALQEKIAYLGPKDISKATLIELLKGVL